MKLSTIFQLGFVAAGLSALLFVATRTDAHKAEQLQQVAARAQSVRDQAMQVRTEIPDKSAKEIWLGPQGKTGSAATQDPWYLFETKDWYLVNRVAKADLCPQVLSKLEDEFALTSSRSGLAMDHLARAWRGKQLQLSLFVPTFPSRPAGLEHCLGWRYDAGTGGLLLGDKPVAFLLNDQPAVTPEPAAASEH